MAFRVVYPANNHVLGLASASIQDGAGGLLPSAAGFPAVNLGSGRLDKPWKRSSASASFSIAVDLGAAKTITQIALLDVYAASGIDDISYEFGTSMVAWGVGAGGFTGGNRRDWAAFLNVSKRYMKINIVLPGAAEVVSVGQLVIGSYTELTMGPADVNVSAEAQTAVNGSQATKRGEERIRLDLRWGRSNSTPHSELLAFQRTVRGALNPFLLTPDSSAPESVYFGRIQDSLRWNVSTPVYGGHAWQFEEMERVLRG